MRDTDIEGWSGKRVLQYTRAEAEEWRGSRVASGRKAWRGVRISDRGICARHKGYTVLDAESYWLRFEHYIEWSSTVFQKPQDESVF